MLQPYKDTEFFSGAQSRVYFGSILVDDIASIEWRGASSKRPVYGYASEQFDAVAKGQYIVNGAFMVPFKEVGYLHAVMAAGKEGHEALDLVLSSVKGLQTPAQQKHTTVESNSAIDPNRNPLVKIKTVGTSNDAGTDEPGFTVTSLNAEQVLAQAAQQEDSKSFKQLTNEYEEAIWNRERTSEDRLPRADEFDIVNGVNGMRFVENGFNILVSFGDLNNPKAASTIKTIVDVHIVSDERIVDSTGQPIYERYSFFARGTDETVGEYSYGPGFTARKGPGSPSVPINETQDDGTTEAYVPPQHRLLGDVRDLLHPPNNFFHNFPVSLPFTSTDPETGRTTFNNGPTEIDNYLDIFGVYPISPSEASKTYYIDGATDFADIPDWLFNAAKGDPILINHLFDGHPYIRTCRGGNDDRYDRFTISAKALIRGIGLFVKLKNKVTNELHWLAFTGAIKVE